MNSADSRPLLQILPALAVSIGLVIGAWAIARHGPSEADVEVKRSPPAKIAPTRNPIGWRLDGSGNFPDPAFRSNGPKSSAVIWKTEVGEGYSSPVVADGRVFITSDPHWLVCVDAENGSLKWKRSNGVKDLPEEFRGKEIEMSTDCGYAAPTPLVAGESVFVVFGTGVVACYEVNGKRRWIRWFEREPAVEYGRSASPVWSGGKLIVHISSLIALNPHTGKILWEQKDAGASYGTPAPARIAAVDVLITPRGDVVRSADGKILAEAIGETTYGSPLVHGNVVYFMDSTVTAVRLPDAAGESIEADEIWVESLDGEFFASPVLAEGRLFGVNNSAVLWALNASTGEIEVNRRLALSSSDSAGGDANIYPSLFTAGGAVHVYNDQGESVALNSGGECEVESRNVLPAGAPGTPVISHGRIIARGESTLYAIGGR